MPKNEQKATNNEETYLPTKKEESLLETLLNPLNRLKNVAEICTLAGCGRDIYYDAFKKPGFVKLYREQSLALIAKGLSPIINSVVREASRGSAQHAKIALTMAGLYTEKVAQDVKHSGEITNKITRVELVALD